MTPEEHKQKHIELHRSLDELLADFISTTSNMPSKTNMHEFLEWSYQQTQNPTGTKNEIKPKNATKNQTS